MCALPFRVRGEERTDRVTDPRKEHVMNLQELRREDHLRAAQIATGVALDDSAMATAALLEAYQDSHPAAVPNVIFALALNLDQTLRAAIGPDATIDLLRRTLAQLVAAEESDS
jgi:hypothetical protein